MIVYPARDLQLHLFCGRSSLSLGSAPNLRLSSLTPTHARQLRTLLQAARTGQAHLQCQQYHCNTSRAGSFSHFSQLPGIKPAIFSVPRSKSPIWRIRRRCRGGSILLLTPSCRHVESRARRGIAMFEPMFTAAVGRPFE